MPAVGEQMIGRHHHGLSFVPLGHIKWQMFVTYSPLSAKINMYTQPIQTLGYIGELGEMVIGGACLHHKYSVTRSALSIWSALVCRSTSKKLISHLIIPYRAPQIAFVKKTNAYWSPAHCNATHYYPMKYLRGYSGFLCVAGE